MPKKINSEITVGMQFAVDSKGVTGGEEAFKHLSEAVKQSVDRLKEATDGLRAFVAESEKLRNKEQADRLQQLSTVLKKTSQEISTSELDAQKKIAAQIDARIAAALKQKQQEVQIVVEAEQQKAKIKAEARDEDRKKEAVFQAEERQKEAAFRDEERKKNLDAYAERLRIATAAHEEERRKEEAARKEKSDQEHAAKKERNFQEEAARAQARRDETIYRRDELLKKVGEFRRSEDFQKGIIDLNSEVIKKAQNAYTSLLTQNTRFTALDAIVKQYAIQGNKPIEQEFAQKRREEATKNFRTWGALSTGETGDFLKQLSEFLKEVKQQRTIPPEERRREREEQARIRQQAEENVRKIFQLGPKQLEGVERAELKTRLKQIEEAIRFKRQQGTVIGKLSQEGPMRKAELVELDKISTTRLKALKAEGLTIGELKKQADEIKNMLAPSGWARLNKAVRQFGKGVAYLQKSIHGAILAITALPRAILRVARAVRDVWTMGSRFYTSIMGGYQSVVGAIWKTSQYGERVGRYAMAYGIDPETYQAWEHVLRRSGQSEEEFGQGLKSLVKHLGPARRAAQKEISTGKTSNDANLDYFRQWGFSPRDILKFSKPEELYLQMLTRAGNMRTAEGALDYANISMLAAKILGGGSEGFTNMAIHYSGNQGALDTDLTRAKALGSSTKEEIDSMRGLKASFEDLSFAAQSAVRKLTVPAIEEVAKGFDFISEQFQTDKMDALLREIGVDFAKEIKDIVTALEKEMGVDSLVDLLAKTYEAIKPLIPGGKQLVSFGAEMISLVTQIAGHLAKFIDFLPSLGDFTDAVAGYLYKDDAVKEYIKGERAAKNPYSQGIYKVGAEALRKLSTEGARSAAMYFNATMGVAPGAGGLTEDDLAEAQTKILEPYSDAEKRRIAEGIFKDWEFEIEEIRKQEKAQREAAKQKAKAAALYNYEGLSLASSEEPMSDPSKIYEIMESAGRVGAELEKQRQDRDRAAKMFETGTSTKGYMRIAQTFLPGNSQPEALSPGVYRPKYKDLGLENRTLIDTIRAGADFVKSKIALNDIIQGVTNLVAGQRLPKVSNTTNVELVLNITTEGEGLFTTEAKIREVADRVYGVVKERIRRAEQNKSPAYSRGLPNGEAAYR